MTRTQKSGWTALLTGLLVFFYQGREILLKHDQWASLATTHGVADIFTVLGAVVLAVGGAWFTKFRTPKAPFAR